MPDDNQKDLDEGASQPEPEPDSQTVRFYSNYAAISATPEEFILRFGERDLKDSSKVAEVVRVYLTLAHAKRLVVAMARSLKAHEELFGEIKADPLVELSPEVKNKLDSLRVKDSIKK